MSKAFKGLLTVAIIVIVTFLLSSNADAKKRQVYINGVLHTTTGEDGQKIDTASWSEKGEKISLSWANTAKTAVKVKKVQTSKKAVALKKYQKRNSARSNQLLATSKAQYMKATANAPMTGAAFEPAAPRTIWSWLWRAFVWPFGYLWDEQVVIPKAIAPTPATVKAVPPASKLKKRVVNKPAPPKTGKCEQKDIKVMKLVPTAPQPPPQTLVAPPVGTPKPATGQAEVGKNKGKLADWEVRFATYWINEKGQRKLVREYLRSPAECYDRRAPDWCEKPRKGIVVYEERYDRHTYVKTSEKPVAPGTVVHFALTPRPDKLDLDHIVRDIDKDNMEIYHSESGRFIPVEKPKALQIAYPTEYHKFYREVSVSPSQQPAVFAEMYDNMKKGSG